MKRVIGLAALLFLSAAPSIAQQGPEKYEGRRLAEALRALQAGGLRIVFSSATVTPDMRVAAEPRSKAARQILDELLKPHGLQAEEGPGAVIQIIRAKPVAAVRPRNLRAENRIGGTVLIRGQVADAITGALLPGVLVQVIGTWQAARTGEEGRFQFTDLQAGVHTLDVSMAGYTPAKLTVQIARGRTLDVDVNLVQGSGAYSERITVTTSRLDRQDAGVSSETSVGISELENLRGVIADDPMRAVQTLPRAATGDDFRSEFSVRGSPYRHIGVVIDGVETPWLQHAIYGGSDTGSISMLTSDLLQRATLQAGAYPRRYGDRLGAQLDMESRQGSRAATHLRGAISATNAAFVGEGPMGKPEQGSWLFSLRKSYLDWPIRQLGESNLTAFAFTDAQAKLAYDVRPSQQVSFSFIGGRSTVDERGDQGPNEFAHGTNRAGVFNLGWRSTFGSSLVLKQRAYWVAHEFLNESQTGQENGRGTDRELSYGLDAARPMFGGLLEAGGQIQRMHGSRRFPRPGGPTWSGLPQPQSPGEFEGSSWQRSGYVHFEWAATPRLTVAPGLRVSDSTLVNRRTVTRWILGEWSVAPAWKLNASAGVSHQFPEFAHVLGGAGTPGLRPERAAHFDIGIEQRLAKTVRWQATFFNRQEREILREPDMNPRLVGGLVSEPPGPERPVRYENALSGSSRGLELLLERRNAAGLSGWVAYSYGKTRYTDPLRNETFWADFDQRHAINASGVYRLSDATSFAVKFRAGTNFPIPGYLAARDGGLFVGTHRNEVRLPNYARLDLRANRAFNYDTRRLTLFVELLNVLDRTNLGLADGFIRYETGEAAGFTEPLIPRFLSAGIVIEF